MKGTVLVVLADTQAAHFLGGFKIGVGFSLRRCRNCLATKESLSTQVNLNAKTNIKITLTKMSRMIHDLQVSIIASL